MKPKLYIVGGYVRDKLMGKTSKDIDFAVEAESFEDMRSHILDLGCNIFIDKPEFGTIRGTHPKYGAVDYVLCRKDGYYSDGRRPDSTSVGTLLDDLSRRDFTVNAIAIDVETDEIIDPFNGQRDIKDTILRCVGSAPERFKEDSLRMLRAIRFSITKDFILHFSISGCLHDPNMIDLLKNVSPERIYEELGKCFKHDSLLTLYALERYTHLQRYIFSQTPIWLKPTLEQR